jgi:hypothetical protein
VRRHVCSERDNARFAVLTSQVCCQASHAQRPERRLVAQHAAHNVHVALGGVNHVGGKHNQQRRRAQQCFQLCGAEPC